MPNHLAQSQSLYLKKHAFNPINWWHWGNEALNQAKAENKPIFLSIGYSSCHWCTVMEGEAFSDPEIALYLNEYFLPIKVDREERPDVDSIYMQALQMMTGQGGWPLNIFLTPEDLIPFYGGTYFPVNPRFGRPGFLQVLESIRRFYDQEKEKLRDIKQEIFTILQQSAFLPSSESDIEADELLSMGIKTNTEVITPSSQDFARPSFPMIPYANLALQNAQAVSYQRGQDLALGGIYDHVGGGFHRYTVDSTWTVPHFEKMLYDNGQILEYLANLWSSGQQQPAFKRAIAGTVKWLKREMTAPLGYFYAAQDADNFASVTDIEPEEGEFYVWKYSQLVAELTKDELEAMEATFFITPAGNFEEKIVLQCRQEGEFLPEVETALDKLFSLRYGQSRSEVLTFSPAPDNEAAKSRPWLGRIPPVTDTKMIVAWNSLMISGLARAYAIFKDGEYWDLATGAARFILENQLVNGRLYRLNYDGVVSGLAQSEDYAFLIKALLDVQTAQPGQRIWLEKALEIQEQFDELFWSIETKGYFNTANDDTQNLIIRERAYMDNATPAANGVALANLVRLARLTDDLEYLERAKEGLQAFGAIMSRSPQACPSLFVALDGYKNGICVKSSLECLEMLAQQYFPRTVYRTPEGLPEGAIGLVCQGLSCLEPAFSEEQLLGQMRGLKS